MGPAAAGRAPSILILLETKSLHRGVVFATTTTTVTTAFSSTTTRSTTTTVIWLVGIGILVLGIKDSGIWGVGSRDARLFHLEERTGLKESRKGRLKGDEINDRAVGFGKTVQGLKNKLFVGYRMTNIGQIVCSLFDLLAIIMYSERALFEGFELFFELNGSIVFVVGKEGSKRSP